MNLIDKDALIEALGIETDCYDCEHERLKYHCDLDPVTVCEKIIQAPVITVTTESAEKAIEVLKNAAWLGAVYSFEETEEAVKTAIRALQVTSAQPEIIHCRECEYGEKDDSGRYFCRDLCCQMGDVWGNGFCSFAERRTDE